MDFRLLRYFQAVGEELNFSRASRRLRVAQPALSRAVAELERQIGARLLDRNRRSVKLTAAGAALMRETASLLQQVDESLRRVRRSASGEEGELLLGYIGPPTQPFLGRLIEEFSRRFPKVSLHLEERTPERVWEMVAKGRLSVGLTRPLPGQGQRALETLLLRREPLGLAVPAKHPLAQRKSVTWKALAGQSLIVLARREGVGLHDEILAACREAGFTPRVSHTPSVVGTVLSYVEAGTGLGIITDSIAAAASAHGLWFVPLRPARYVPLVLVWNPDQDEPPVRAFRELLAEWLRDGKLWPGSKIRR